MKTKGRDCAGVTLVLVGLLLGGGCHAAMTGSEVSEAFSGGAPTPSTQTAGFSPIPATRVAASPVRWQLPEVHVAAPRVLFGQVDPLGTTSVGFELGGTLQRLDVEVGMTVAAGDVLARLDPDALRIERRALDARDREVAVRRTQAVRDRDRAAQLLAGQATTAQELADRESAIEALDATAAGLRAQRAELERLSRRTTLTAPVAGRVHAVLARAGTAVQPTQPVVQLVADDGYEAVLDVPEAWFATLRGVPTVEIQVGTANEAWHTVAVRAWNDPVLPMSPLPTLRVALPEDTVAWAGQRVRARVAAPSGTLLAVPATAVRGRPDAHIWVHRDGVAQQVRVTVAGRTEEHVLVSEGLQPGEQVATGDLDSLRAGLAVPLPDAASDEESATPVGAVHGAAEIAPQSEAQ